MKKIFPVFLFIIIFSSNLQSQFLKHEVSLSYGTGSIQQIGTGLGILIFSSFTFFTSESQVENPTGPVILRYNNFLSKNVNVGFTASYTHAQVTNTAIIEPAEVIHYDFKFYTIMAGINYNYIPRNSVQFYSGVSAGISYANAKATGTNPANASGSMFAYQFNALGIRVGNNVGGFIELGFGYNGMINGGLSVKF